MSAEITVKQSKCCLGYSKIYFVSHKVGEGHLMTQEEKVERMQEAVTQARSFLGHTGYYRKFTPNYVSIATPLTDLTKK